MLVETEAIRFGRIVLDTRPPRRALLFDNKPVELDAKAFDILEYLVKHRDRPLHPDEILKNVYRATVSPNNVAVQISNIRRALKQAGCINDMIYTWKQPTRYQFVGEITPPETACTPPFAPPPPSFEQIPQHELPSIAPIARRVPRVRRPIIMAACLAVLCVACITAWRHYAAAPQAPRLSIAVLPFRNLGDDHSQDHLVDAISDDLTSDLAHIPASTVIARESSDIYRGKAVPVQQIGRELGVRYLLEGSVRPEGAIFHINAQLIDAATGAHLGAWPFNVANNKVSDLRDKIVHRIASAIGFKLDQLESSRSLKDRPDDPDALDLFVRARAILDVKTLLADFNRAQQLLEKAILKQPDFAEAKAELGWMLLHKVTGLDDPDEAADYAEAKRIIAEALTASPENAKALAALAREYQIEHRCPQAKRVAERVLSMESSSLEAHSVLARCLLSENRLDDAAAQIESILELDPENTLNKTRYLSLGTIRLIEGRTGDAVDFLERAQADVASSSGDMSAGEQARLMLIAAEELNGDHPRAKQDYALYESQTHGRTTWRIGTWLPKGWLPLPGVQRLLNALHAAGMPDYADEAKAEVGADTLCGGKTGEFAPTPTTMAGGQVLFTSGLLQLLNTSTPPILIDVGRGAAPLPHSHVYDATKDGAPDNFVHRVVSDVPGAGKATQIVVLGDGPTGCASFNAARLLVTMGYTHVYWYRGGEEAWFKSTRGPSALGHPEGK